MEELMLGDPSIKPTDELIENILGERIKLWQDIHVILGNDYPDASGDWNYYKDGHQWLYKMVLKKKTVFWGAMLKDSFRITFYFGDKAEPAIEMSNLPSGIKSAFISAKRYGKIRPISILVKISSDVESIKKLIDLKISMK